MKFVVYPEGGLANRIRCINSAWNFFLSKKKGKKDKLVIRWRKEWGMNCGWHDVFSSNGILISDDRKNKDVIWCLLKHKNKRIVKCVFDILSFLRIAFFFVVVDQEGMDRVKSFSRRGLFCYVNTCEEFYSGGFHKELFVLKDEERLNQELKKIDPKNTIGVHVRRTDNELSIKYSPLELFDSIMKKEKELNPLLRFYVCSDDISVKNHFRTEEWKGVVVVPEGVVDRESKEGIIQAAIELFTLAQTKKILASYWSSFGEIAARLGSTELQIVYST